MIERAASRPGLLAHRENNAVVNEPREITKRTVRFCFLGFTLCANANCSKNHRYSESGTAALSVSPTVRPTYQTAGRCHRTRCRGGFCKLLNKFRGLRKRAFAKQFPGVGTEIGLVRSPFFKYVIHEVVQASFEPPLAVYLSAEASWPILPTRYEYRQRVAPTFQRGNSLGGKLTDIVPSRSCLTRK
jgi:hypothetical protein